MGRREGGGREGEGEGVGREGGGREGEGGGGREGGRGRGRGREGGKGGGRIERGSMLVCLSNVAFHIQCAHTF